MLLPAMDGGQAAAVRSAKARHAAAKEACDAALSTHRAVHWVEPGMAACAESAVSAARAMQRHAEEAAMAAREVCVGHAGSVASSGPAELAGCEAMQAAGKAARAVALSGHAAVLSGTPFPEDLVQCIVRALRAGIVIRALAEDEAHASHDEQAVYEGVGLSFGGNALRRYRLCCDEVTPEDEVSFSVDSHWVSWEDRHEQRCAPVALGNPGQHMGPHGMSPAELAPEACRGLPAVLRWPHECAFAAFLAGHSERSLALLLGSAPYGSITLRKLEAAAGLHGVRRSARLSAQPVEDRRRDEATLEIELARASLAALERAIESSHQKLIEHVQASCSTPRAPELPHPTHGEATHGVAREWAQQLLAQVELLAQRLDTLPTDAVGIAGSSLRGLKCDVLRHARQLRVRGAGLLGARGRVPGPRGP
mmetsp:Transcript_21537/g.62381  ORF Transcript_21537/g.62381 Transcript_21537/m.62381 type:complete len:423 (+) Transcript_21537:59-1327(+)